MNIRVKQLEKLTKDWQLMQERKFLALSRFLLEEKEMFLCLLTWVDIIVKGLE